MTRILQISDPHIGVPGTLLGGMIDTAAALTRTVEWIARNLRAIGPVDAVILTGDLVESGCLGEYAHFLRLIAPLPLPWFAIPGNHDNREVMREAFSHLHWMPDHARSTCTCNSTGWMWWRWTAMSPVPAMGCWATARWGFWTGRWTRQGGDRCSRQSITTRSIPGSGRWMRCRC